MKCLLLGAGYATRLYPLTQDRPKPLLPVGGRPMIEWILDRVLALPEVDAVSIVSNHRFIDAYRAWLRDLETRRRPLPPIVLHDDGSTTNEDRLGAIGDIHFAVRQARIDDDLLIVAGDNLFEFGLDGLARTFRARGASVVGLLDLAGKPEEKFISKYSEARLDGAGRIASFVEKPPQPKGTLIAIAVYLYARRDIPKFKTYLDAGQKPDQPGLFVKWLVETGVPVYGHVFQGDWLDIGGHEEYQKADAQYRAKGKK